MQSSYGPYAMLLRYCTVSTVSSKITRPNKGFGNSLGSKPYFPYIAGTRASCVTELTVETVQYLKRVGISVTQAYSDEYHDSVADAVFPNYATADTVMELLSPC